MDQGSKSSLKIVGMIALVAIVGAFGYSSMRSNSLEQSGRVLETPQISTENGCPGSVTYQGDSCTVAYTNCSYQDGTTNYVTNSQTGEVTPCCQIGTSTCVSQMGDDLVNLNLKAVPKK